MPTSQAGIGYQLLLNGENFGDPVISDGSTINFEIENSDLLEGSNAVMFMASLDNCSSQELINFVEVIKTTLDVEITEIDGTFNSNYATGNRWFLNDELLEGVTSQSIVVSEPGVYSLEVTQNGCTSSVSREFAVTSLVVDFETFATVFPNPTSDKWIIDIKSNNNFNTIRLTDLNGKIILSQSIQEGKRVVLSSTNLRKGIYLLSLIGEDEFTVKRVIKN
ncbi:MAG: T9SS type A sorting domain-containing protein [Fulvivirga sp.]